MTPIPWVPVRNYGCGDRDGCLTCGPMIELEIENEHRRRVANTYPRFTAADQVNAWLGEAYGTGADRSFNTARATKATKEERTLALAARDRGRERILVKRSISKEAEAQVIEQLDAAPVRHVYLRRTPRGKLTRTEWKVEVWLQLLNPSALVAHRERNMPLERKVERAISRGQDVMRGERKRISREATAAGRLSTEEAS